MTRHTVDFAVAGAGIVGITAALLLARNGYGVVLIDPAEPPGPLPRTSDYDIRTYALTPASMRVFTALGAASTLVHERLAAFTRMQVWDAGSDGMLHFDAGRLGRESLGTMIEHANLHAALHALAAGTSGLTRIRAAVAATETGDERCTLHLDNGDHVDAALVLACDGANSPLRTQLGIAPNASAFRQDAIICNVETEHAHALIARQRFLEHGPLAFLPLPPAHACAVVWTTSPEAAAAAVAAPDAVFAAQLVDAFNGELGAIRAAGPRRAVPLQRLHAQHYVAGRVVLLGDAAHVVHPLAGQGLNLGIMDAAALAEVFGQRSELELKFPRSALSRFERMRRGENLVMLQTTTALNRLFRDQRRIGKRARGLGMRAVDAMVPLKHWLMLRAMGDAGDVPAIAAFHPAP